jgi:hypothetical protein
MAGSWSEGVLVVMATRDRDMANDGLTTRYTPDGLPASGLGDGVGGVGGDGLGDGGTRRTVAVAGPVAVLIAANAVVMADDPYHWWANFIMLPGLVLIGVGLGLARAARETRLVLIWMGTIILVTSLLLLTGSMGELWPFMIIVPCLGPVTLFALRPTDPSVRAFVNTVAGLGAVAAALGVAFLLLRDGAIHLDNVRWWAWFMLAAAAVPAFNGAVLLAGRRGTYWFSMAVLLIALGGYTTLAAFAQLNR